MSVWAPEHPARRNPYLGGRRVAQRQAPKRRASTVESIDVSTKLYTCCDCSQGVRLGVTDPLPLGWRVLQGATLGAWLYVCPGCAGRGARR